MKKLLILGSDFGTIDVVNEAHKMGLYVIVTDTMETSPTKQVADEAWYISTTELDILEKKCREENISGIMFGASDFNISLARQLTKRLGLPIYCRNDRCWEVARNKREFKNICKSVGAPIATDYYLSDSLSEDELNQVIFPVVVKPVDKSGNRGMSYCYNKEQLVAAYKYAREVSDNSTIIVERMLQGPEFEADYVIANGEIDLLLFSSEHHQPGQLANLYSYMNTTSYHLKQYLEEVNNPLIAAFKEAQCKEGIVWAESMLDKDGHFYLLEMGYRFPGEMFFLPYEKVRGFNAVRWMIEVAMGIKHQKEDLPGGLVDGHKDCAATYHLFTVSDGTIGSIEGLDEIEQMPNVWLDMPKRVGNTVRKSACMGTIRFYAKDYLEIKSIMDKINSSLKIKDTQGKDLFIYYTDLESIEEEHKNSLLEFSLE